MSLMLYDLKTYQNVRTKSKSQNSIEWAQSNSTEKGYFSTKDPRTTEWPYVKKKLLSHT